MWKKDEKDGDESVPFAEPAGESRPNFNAGPPAVIGGSLTINGNISGKEDLLVEGKVEGDISLPDNVVTVGGSGEVNARIQAAIIVVEGRVEGDLVGEEQIEIRRSGNVLGNIKAPRVGLEDGAQFKGNIDMSPKAKSSKPTGMTPPKPESKPAADAKPVSQTADPKLPGQS
ncbi:MAG: polymer-forming cytoskeletal protein [Xanthomonadales bacterium]|nr:polymer-forming cytoskeletal protein [Xanthomonadales bacterium]